MRRAALLILVAGLLTAAGAFWWVGSVLSRPSLRPVGAPPPALDVRDVVFESALGVRVSGWYGAPPPDGAVVVLAHGIWGDRRQLADRAVFLQRAGYGVLLYDNQAHGESSGERITFGHREAYDAAAAVDFAREQAPGARIGFLGASLGGAAALLGPRPLPVDALVLEAVFSTLERAVRNRVELVVGAGFAPTLTSVLLWQVEPRLGFDPLELDPIDNIGRVGAPVLLIAGTADLRTTLEESRALFAAARDPKELWLLDGAGHANFHRFAGAAYESRILAFFARTLGR